MTLATLPPITVQVATDPGDIAARIARGWRVISYGTKRGAPFALLANIHARCRTGRCNWLGLATCKCGREAKA